MKCFVYEIVRLIMKTIQFRCVFTYLVILYCSIAVFCGSSTLLLLNETENHPSETRDSSHANRFVFETDTILKREKRYLLWTGGGNAQFSIRLSQPIDLKDRVDWRALSSSFRFYFPYTPIPNTTYLWNGFAADLRKQRKLYDEQGVYLHDQTRKIIYGAVEILFNAKGKPGRQCLLKSICDAAEHPIIRGGIFEEIVHLVLSPNEDENIDDDYKNARFAGERGEECAQIYRCSHGDGLLDKCSYLS